MKQFFAGLGILIAFLAITWVFQGDAFFLYRYFAPRQEAVRRQVFKQSQAYNDGMAQQLSDIQREYAHADSTQKIMLASTVYHRYASYDESLLTPDLRQFLASIRSYETSSNGNLP